jgi:hypothetical protein
MPFRYLGDLHELNGHALFGEGECVDLIKALVPGLQRISTQVWRKGATVKDSPGLARGTAIATFGPDGRFPRANTGQHAALFVAHAGAGMYVVEQYQASLVVVFRHMSVPREHSIRPDGTFPIRSRNPLAFSVIER